MFGFTFSPRILTSVVSDDAEQHLMLMSNGSLAIEENDGNGHSTYICIEQATLRKLSEMLARPDVQTLISE